MRRVWTVLVLAAALLPATARAADPSVAITAGPQGPTKDPAPAFSFTADPALPVVTCRLDGPGGRVETVTPCSSPHQVPSLADGAYVFTVEATDAATTAQDSRAFVVDTVPPAAPAIASPADGAAVRGPAVVVSGAAEPRATVSLLDAGAAIASSVAADDGSWSATVQLADGVHPLTAVATDLAGNASAASRTHAVTVDSVPPETTITGGPAGLTNHASATFAVGSSEGGSVFECRLAGPGHEAGFAPCAAGATYDGLADGAYTFAARAIDAAGNVDATPATREFTVDTTPPAAPALSGTPAAFAFSSEAGASFACALGPGPFAPCVSPLSLPGLPPGSYTLRVRATDAAGNTGPAAAVGFSVPAPLPLLVPPAPIPVFHAAVVVRPGLADVRVRLPGTARYVALTTDRALPPGSVLDTRRGTVQLISVPRRGGKPQRASFTGAVFRVTQPRGTTVLTLVGRCRPAQRLVGDGRGAFQVRGRYSTATVRGTRWVVRDSCSGTLTRVLEGVVQVRDQVRRRTVLLRAGRRYLARPKA